MFAVWMWLSSAASAAAANAPTASSSARPTSLWVEPLGLEWRYDDRGPSPDIRCTLGGVDITRQEPLPIDVERLPLVGSFNVHRPRRPGSAGVVRVGWRLHGQTEVVTDDQGTFEDTRFTLVETGFAYERREGGWPELTTLMRAYGYPICDVRRLQREDVVELLRPASTRRLVRTWLWASLALEPTGAGHWQDLSLTQLDAPDHVGRFAAACAHPLHPKCQAAIDGIWR